jgi:hypothetical protein
VFYRKEGDADYVASILRELDSGSHKSGDDGNGPASWWFWATKRTW